jgi:PDDEXK-like domain of unknown function (DUF3799)
MKISKPGLYAAIPMADYHGDCCDGPSVSSSGLRTIFDQSPAHYFVESPYNAQRIEPEEKEAFVLGRAAHHLLLGEDDFSTQFIVRPDEAPDGRAWNGNNNSCRDWLVKQAKSGRTVLTPGQIETIRGMARVLADHPLIQSGILNGAIEQSLFWKDKATGVWLKVRPDAIPNDSGDFADLKTTIHYGFDLDRDVSNRRYDMQAALAGMASREVLGREMESFSFVFVGKKPPYSVEILTLDKEDIQRAEHDIRVAIDTFAWCFEHNNWFGPAGTQLDARYVHISEFAKRDAEYRRDFLKREIARAEAATPKYTEVDYAGAP